MNYQETLDYLYSRLPMFTRIGSAAFKKDLTNTLKLCAALGDPHKKFTSVHIAGTNGKGSVSHMLAAILQAQGYKTGLYTSPHLLDFRERIRINGNKIPEDKVIAFVERNKDLIEEVEPSFFEMTVAMAFQHFAEEEVDVAVIETGLGGRLDSTNVITPLLSIITNISYDHQNMLGNTLQEIAGEKAGIIKPGIPVIIGKTQEETKEVFLAKAKECNSEIHFADSYINCLSSKLEDGLLKADFTDNQNGKVSSLKTPLAGNYQLENLATVLASVKELNRLGKNISGKALHTGIREVKKLTGFLGRWEVISQKPLIICDVAHNEAGLKKVFEQINTLKFRTLRMVYGMVRDKDVNAALELLPKEAVYYFSEPQIPRALPIRDLAERASAAQLNFKTFRAIEEACRQAVSDAAEDDLVLIAGSFFVVAEALPVFNIS